MVEYNGKYGFIDRNGALVVEPRYDNISYFNKNKNDWAEVKRNGKYGFLDRSGKEVIPAVLDDFRNDKMFELEELFPSKGYVINGMGAVKRYLVSPFLGDFAIIKHKKTNKVGVINSQFEMVIPPKHDKVLLEENGSIHVW